MEKFIEFVRENLFWLVFGGFILWNFLRRKKVSPELTAIMIVDSIEKAYLSDKGMVQVDISAFPVGSQGYPSEIASQLGQLGLPLNCNVRYDVHLWSSQVYYQVMHDPDGLVSVDFGVNVSNNKVINFGWSAFTSFSDGRFMTTFPHGQKEPKDWGISFVNEESSYSTVSEVVSYHRRRVEEYLAANPGVCAIPIMNYDDLTALFARERAARKKYLPLKGCLLTRREFDDFCPPMPSAIREKTWLAFLQEQKKRGYIPGGEVSREISVQESVRLADVDSGAEIVALADDEPQEDEYLSSVRKQIVAAQTEKKSLWSGLPTLLITLVIFFNLGWFKWGMDFVLFLVAVLFIHELGHFIAMKLFGYRNLQMFFIPLLGAAVSGHGHSVPTYKKVIVSLAGPLPGIIIGVGLIWYSLAYNSDFFRRAGFLFMFLNGFNLIPFLPLDGGWVLYHTLSSRWYVFDTAVRVIAIVLFGYFGFMFNDFIFYLLAAVNLAGAVASWKEAGFLRQLKNDIAEYDQTHTVVAGSYGPLHVPSELLGKMVKYIREKKNKRLSSLVARDVVDLWEKVVNKPTGIVATVLLWLGFIVIGWGGVGFGVLLARGEFEEVFSRAEIVQAVNQQGQPVLAEVVYLYNNSDNIDREVELSEDGSLYDGLGRYYLRGQLYATVNWENGDIVSQIVQYDELGEEFRISEISYGIIVSQKEKDSDGNWIEVSEDDIFISNYLLDICYSSSGPDELVLENWQKKNNQAGVVTGM